MDPNNQGLLIGVEMWALAASFGSPNSTELCSSSNFEPKLPTGVAMARMKNPILLQIESCTSARQTSLQA
jgi:hypothetical protein